MSDSGILMPNWASAFRKKLNSEFGFHSLPRLTFNKEVNCISTMSLHKQSYLLRFILTLILLPRYYAYLNKHLYRQAKDRPNPFGPDLVPR